MNICRLGKRQCIILQRHWGQPMDPSSRRIYELMIQTCVAISWKIMIRSFHNFAHATTAEMWWPVQNKQTKTNQKKTLHDLIGIIIEANIIFTRFQLWAHKPFVTWVSVNTWRDDNVIICLNNAMMSAWYHNAAITMFILRFVYVETEIRIYHWMGYKPMCGEPWLLIERFTKEFFIGIQIRGAFRFT